MGSVEDALKYIATNEIRWIDLHFVDVRGTLHRVSVSNKEVGEDAFVKGLPVVRLEEVFGKSEQGELSLLPDPDSIARIPWETSTVRMFCDVMVALSGERFLKDSRHVAERVESNFQALGIKEARLSSEVEFYIFDTATTDRMTTGRGSGTLVDSREAPWSPSPLSSVEKGSFLSQPFDSMYPARVQIAETLEESFGYEIRSHHHGRGRVAQQSVRMGEHPAPTAADALLTLKFVTRNLSHAVNSSCTFMPYPVPGEKGSALHLSQSLWKTADNNVFYDGAEKYAQLSQAARYYIGGILEHLRALMLFTSPTSNSYKRLAIDPLQVGWSKQRGNSIVQVPHLLKNTKEARSIVFSGSDPSINPHVAFAAVLSAGLDGIRNKIDPGDPLEEEGGGKKKKERAALPRNLYEAIEALESDPKFIKGIIPPELLGDYLDLKLGEHRDSLKALSSWEMEKYFNV